MSWDRFRISRVVTSMRINFIRIVILRWNSYVVKFTKRGVVADIAVVDAYFQALDFKDLVLDDVMEAQHCQLILTEFLILVLVAGAALLVAFEAA